MTNHPSKSSQIWEPPARQRGISALAAAILSRWLRHTLLLMLLCGSPSVLAQTAQSESDLIMARIHASALVLGSDARNSKLAHEQLEKLAEFLAGNLAFAILHESGHAVIADMSLPVLGQEEDAADTYAIIAMLRMGTVATHGVLTSAAKGWFYSDRNDRDHGAPFDYYDNHGLDVQRAYRIVCLMVGADQEKFKGLADETKLSEQRQDSCSADYADARWSWDQVLKSHRRSPEQPRTEISVVYGEAKGHLDIYRRFFASIQVAEVSAGHLADSLVWRGPFAIEWQTCGSAGAHWQFSARKPIVCYELADEFARLIATTATSRSRPRKSVCPRSARTSRRNCTARRIDMAFLFQMLADQPRRHLGKSRAGPDTDLPTWIL
jgi:hypothetical protein